MVDYGYLENFDMVSEVEVGVKVGIESAIEGWV